MLTGLLMLRWLNPSEIGLWQAVTIIQAYLPFAQLGIQSGMNRDLPVMLGKGETEKAHAFVSTAKYFAILLSILFLILTIITVIILLFLKQSTSLVLGVATIGIMASSFSFQNHMGVTFRTTQSFNKLSNVNLIHSFIILGCLYFIYEFNYYGILIFNVVSSLTLLFLTYQVRPFKEVKMIFNFSVFKKMLKTGIIMMSFVQLHDAAVSIPKIIILKLKGTFLLGLYSPALAVNVLFTLIPNAIAQYFHPQMGYKFGEQGNASSLWKSTNQLFWLLIVVSIPVAILLWFSAPYILEYVFPKYKDALWPMRIMAVAFIFSSTYTTHGVLYSIKAYKYAYIYSFFELIGYLLFPYLCTYFFSNILISITIGILFNNIILAAINYITLYFVLHLKKYNEFNNIDSFCLK